jgi:hypothetical protein
MILQTAGALTLSALLMFLPAGTFAWPQGWLFLALFFSSADRSASGGSFSPDQ